MVRLLVVPDIKRCVDADLNVVNDLLGRFRADRYIDLAVFAFEPAPPPVVPLKRFLDDFDCFGRVVAGPVIFAATLDIVFLVHRVVFEDDQTGMRRDDIEVFGKRNDLLYVGHVRFEQFVNVTLGPKPRQVLCFCFGAFNVGCLGNQLGSNSALESDRGRQRFVGHRGNGQGLAGGQHG